MTATSTNQEQIKHQRGHLSRAVITTAGLRVAHSAGLENLTMKRLATELSITPMAIYRHFNDKTDLIDAVLNEYVKEQDICNHAVPTTEWVNWLKATYSKMYDGLQSMPSVYPYLSTASRFGPAATEVVEQTLRVMQDAGFNLLSATQAANALNGFVIGCAIMDNAFYENLAQADELTKAAVVQDQFPSLESGLNLIISALQHEYSNINTATKIDNNQQ